MSQPDPDSIFVDYRAHRRRWLVVLAVAAIVVVLLTGGYAVRSTISSPAAAVQSYFDALADRDIEAALAVVAPEVADQVDRDLINSEVLRSEAYRPPEQLSIGEVSIDGDGAVVELTYVVDDRSSAVALRLRREDGLADRFVPRWLVVDAIGSIALREAPDQVSVNGHPVAGHDAGGPRVLPALPGGYQLGVPPDDPLWQERALPIRVDLQQASDVAVAMAVRPAAREAVEQRLAALLDGCVASTELHPPGCPFGYAVLAQADDVRWQITRYPSLAIAPGRELGESVLVVTSSRDGEATISGTRVRGGPFETAVPFPVSGVAIWRGGSVIFQPGW